nr:hypothetical protein [Tanacetum cinerariifolium]
MTIDQQVALDKDLVPHPSRLRIGKRNFHLRSDITSKESTLQLEFWATVIVHHHSIHFKMDNKKRIVNLEYFKEMLHICLRLPGQTFDELSFKEEILAFLKFLGHSGEIRKLTDVNINKLHQPWRSFTAIINKCLNGKSTGYDSLRFIKVIIHYFMTKDPLIPRRNKVNWHYVRDDQMFTMIKLVSRHQNTQQFGVILPVELTNEDIRNSEAYKEYYTVASGAAPPKTKASVRKTKSSSDTTITPPTAVGIGLSTSTKDKLTANDEFVHPKLSIHEEEETKDEESFDPIIQTPKNSDDKGNDDANLGLNLGSEEGHDAEDNDDELYIDVNINLEGRDVQMTDVHTTQEFEDTHVTLTSVNPDGQQQITLKRRRDDADKDEEPSDGLDRGSKRRREGKEHESTSAPKEKATKTAGKSTQGRKYIISVTKTKASNYGYIKWIKDLVPRTMWIQEPVSYEKHALWGISYWGRKRQQFYGFAVNRESARDVYSKRRIIAVDDKLYKFKEGDFKRLHIQDIKDMLLLLVQGKLTNLTVAEPFAFNVSLRMFTRSIVIQRHVEDL